MSVRRALRWLLVLAWLYLVVFLSRQNGSDSAAISGWIAQKGSSALSFIGINAHYATHAFVRKFAHFCVHLVLAWLMYRALDISFTGQKFVILLCIIFCSIIAVFDESVQNTAPGRVAQLYDAILNLFGVQCGTILGILTVRQKVDRP